MLNPRIKGLIDPHTQTLQYKHQLNHTNLIQSQHFVTPQLSARADITYCSIWRWVDNIKLDLGETGWGSVDCIGLAQDRNKWRALVNAVLDLRVPWNAGKLSSGLSSSAQLHNRRYGMHSVMANAISTLGPMHVPCDCPFWLASLSVPFLVYCLCSSAVSYCSTTNAG
jgi:hypothetical protein